MYEEVEQEKGNEHCEYKWIISEKESRGIDMETKTHRQGLYQKI